jgi:hypothetical protein
LPKKIEIFGVVVNSNIFTRIFGHSTVHLDLKDLLELKEFKDLGCIKLKELKDLELTGFEDLELELLNSWT